MGEANEFGEDTAASLPPFVEVELVYQTGRAGMVSSNRWLALEVWTGAAALDLEESKLGRR